MSVNQADRVIDHRERFGDYDDLDDLDAVRGFPRDFLGELKAGHLAVPDSADGVHEVERKLRHLVLVDAGQMNQLWRWMHATFSTR